MQNISDYYNLLQYFQNSKFSLVVQFLRRELSSQIHGVCGRSTSDTNPLTRDPRWFTERFDAKSGYVLFNQTIYYLYFTDQQPIFEACAFNTPPSNETWPEICALFPSETDSIRDAIDQELANITALIRPVLPAILPTLNSQLLGPYFINKYSSDWPLLDFCDINLCVTTDEQDTRQYNTKNNRPTLIFHSQKKQYFLYGNNRHDWQLVPIEHALLKEDIFNNTILKYNPRYTPLYQYIIDIAAHRHVSDKPEQVSQLNKIMHGLLGITVLLQKTEEITWITILTSFTSGLSKIKKEFYDKAYQAIHLLIDFDINFLEIFAEEISGALSESATWPPYLLQFIPQAIHTEKSPWTYCREYAYQFGENLGHATRHIYAEDGKLDFKVLSDFSAMLPKHIDTLTTFINNQTKTVTQHAPNINRAQLDILQKEATTLLRALKNNQTANLGLWQIINYIYLIRQVIILLSSTVSQIGYLDGAYQELIRTYLQIIKYQLLPKLFALGDKIEIECMLKPGSITQLFMQRITDFYAFISPYLKNIANFSMLGEALLTVEDAKFMRLRNSAIQAIENDCHMTEIKLSWFQKDSTDFFRMLRNNCHNKEELLKKYQMIIAQCQRMDRITNDQILDFLSQSPCSLSATYIDSVQYYVDTYYKRIMATQNLRRKQCHAIRENINRYANLYVFPYGELGGCPIKLLVVAKDTDLTKLVVKRYPMLIRKTNQYYLLGNKDGMSWEYTPIPTQYIDAELLQRFDKLAENKEESLDYNEKHLSLYQQIIIKKAHLHFLSVFDEKNQEEVLDSDNSQSLLTLHCWYLNKEQAFINAMKQLNTLRKIIKDTFQDTSTIIQFTPNDPVQKECKILYADVQAYLVSLAEFRKFDQAMTNLLASESQSQHTMTVHSFDTILKQLTPDYEKKTRDYWKRKRLLFSLEARRRYQQNHVMVDKIPINSRAAYELGNTDFSKTVEKIMQGLAAWGEMIGSTNTNSSSKLHILFRRCDKFLSHLKDFAIKLEALKNIDYIQDAQDRTTAKEKQLEEVILPMYADISGLIAVGKLFYQDEYLKQITHNGYIEMMALISALSQLIEPYTCSPQKIVFKQNVQYAGLWYTINALYVLPNHLLDLTGQTVWTHEIRNTIQKNAKKTTVTIEYLIKHSQSYPQLFFSMYHIYWLNQELRGKLAQFGAICYQVVHDHCKDIKRDYIGKVLLWLMRWEDRIDLEPFTLVIPVQTLLMDWYQGLVYPLHYSFKEKEAFVCSSLAITEAITKEQTYLAAINLRLDICNKQLAALDSFLTEVSVFKQNIFEIFFSQECNQSLKHNYSNKVLPLLSEYGLTVPKTLERSTVDQIEKNINNCKNYLKDIVKNNRLAIARCENKINLLNDLNTVPRISAKEYRKSFAKKHFDYHLNKLCKEKIKFKNSEIEENYIQWLTAYINAKKVTMLNRVESCDNLDTCIADELQYLNKTFREEYEQEFKQLDIILTAIQECKNSVFAEPLHGDLRDKKIDFLCKLQMSLIPNQDNGVVCLRSYLKLKQITVQLQLLRYKEYLLEKEPIQGFMSWILASIWWCLAALGLYKSAFAESYNKLTAVSAFSGGLFSKTQLQQAGYSHKPTTQAIERHHADTFKV